ncbi:MAG: threonine synthase [Gemmatimonadota bacterium]
MAQLPARPRCVSCKSVPSPPFNSTQSTCQLCNGLLEVIQSPQIRGDELKARFRSSDARSGVWRYREVVYPDSTTTLVSWPEGNTPLIARDVISDHTGCDGLLLKHEGMNPTGSFKDRGMTVAVTHATAVGASAVGCASTGNTSASLAAYASLARVPAIVFVPAGQVAAGKLTQTVAYGARTLLVRGDFDQCLALMLEASRELNVALANSVNPWRIEGQKTIVFETLEQLQWDAPDWIALPAGNLGNTAAFGKALAEAREWGLIDRVPRLLAVQATGASPFRQGFEENFTRRHRVTADTRATAIRIGDPASWERAVASIRATNGFVTAVTDDEIFESKAVVDGAGVGCEPASAASVAGVRQLVRHGLIKPGDRVVAVLTGHVLKDPGLIQWYHQDLEPRPRLANPPVEIDPDLTSVARVLGRI